MTPITFLQRVVIIAGLFGLAACGTTKDPTGTTPSPRNVAANPHEKIGKPYYVSGIRYVPREQPEYVETGIASWYGSQFHGRLTANGEIFDMYRLTAAHKTLPLPSLVRVTNLENGRDIVVRLNDRGPFSGDRIIDLSKKTADTLGMKEQGLARVRVEYLGPADLDHAIVAVGEAENYAALQPSQRERETPEILLAQAESEMAPAPEPIRAVAAAPDEEAEGPEPIRVVLSEDVIPNARNVPMSRPVTPESGPVAYFVQVGVFEDPENAQEAATRFAEVIPMRIEAVAVGDIMRKRVRIGPYAHEFAAEAALREALAQGFEDAHIVRHGVLY